MNAGARRVQRVYVVLFPLHTRVATLLTLDSRGGSEAFRHSAEDLGLLKKLQQLLMTMSAVALPDDLAGRDIERRETERSCHARCNHATVALYARPLRQQRTRRPTDARDGRLRQAGETARLTVYDARKLSTGDRAALSGGSNGDRGGFDRGVSTNRRTRG
jgi:hypothetical protein